MSLAERWQNLSARERVLLLAMTAAVAVVALAALFSGKGNQAESAGRLDQVLEQEQKLNHLLATYQDSAARLDHLENRLRQTPADFDLYKHLNTLVDQAGIRAGVQKMDPVEGTPTDYFTQDYVDMNIQKVEFIPLVNFLKSVEESPGAIRIDQLTLKKRFDQSNTLDATVRVAWYRLKEGS